MAMTFKIKRKNSHAFEIFLQQNFDRRKSFQLSVPSEKPNVQYLNNNISSC